MDYVTGLKLAMELIDREMETDKKNILVTTGLSLAKVIIQKELNERILKLVKVHYDESNEEESKKLKERWHCLIE